MSADPEKAMQIANAIVQSYLAQQTNSAPMRRARFRNRLSSRLEELQSAVRAAEDRVEAFKARTISSASTASSSTSSSSRHEQPARAARPRSPKPRRGSTRSNRCSASGRDRRFPGAVQSPTIGALRMQYAEVMRREAEQMTSSARVIRRCSTSRPRRAAALDDPRRDQSRRDVGAHRISQRQGQRAELADNLEGSSTPPSSPTKPRSGCASSTGRCRRAARSMRPSWSAPAKPASRPGSTPRTSTSFRRRMCR